MLINLYFVLATEIKVVRKRVPIVPRIEAQFLRLIRLRVELASFRMDSNDELKKHVIKVNDKIQELIWKDCRFFRESNKERYKMSMETPSQKMILKLIWKTNPEKHHNKSYEALVTKFIKEYLKWGVRRTTTLSISPSHRKRDNKIFSFLWIVNKEVELSRSL